MMVQLSVWHELTFGDNGYEYCEECVELFRNQLAMQEFDIIIVYVGRCCYL